MIDKTSRILDIIYYLIKGNQLNKYDIMSDYSISEKTFKRDIKILKQIEFLTVNYDKEYLTGNIKEKKS